jgi:hypothetical protein
MTDDAILDVIAAVPSEPPGDLFIGTLRAKDILAKLRAAGWTVVRIEDTPMTPELETWVRAQRQETRQQ